MMNINKAASEPLRCFMRVLLKVDVVTLIRIAWYLTMVAVSVLALLPVEHLQMPIFNWWDKAQHTLAFWVLTIWALLLWPNAVMHVVSGMLAYGAGIELAQWVVGWRFAEWSDLAADAAGVLLAWGLFKGLNGPRKSHERVVGAGKERESC